MTGSRFRLEVFELPDTGNETVKVTVSEREEMRLTAFEKGYTAGWDDAVAAQEGESRKLRADLARNLQDLSFTYHESRTHVLGAMEPLLRDMVSKVLPAIARKSLGQVALEALRPLAEEAAGGPISVVVNPASREIVEELLTAKVAMPFAFVEEPSLSEGQVYLRFGDAEHRVDLDGVISAIGAAIAAFFESQIEVSDG